MKSFAIIELAQKRLAAAEENYALVNEAYLDGATSFLDVVDAKQLLLSSNIAARQAVYEFLSNLLSLEQSMAYYPFLESDPDARVRELEAMIQR
jgi:outer membrane protein